jgi:hypothetical protein
MLEDEELDRMLASERRLIEHGRLTNIELADAIAGLILSRVGDGPSVVKKNSPTNDGWPGHGGGNDAQCLSDCYVTVAA